ncbi:putative lipid phosphate phosphatase 3 [Escovopsis weberi]|uniref:Putative lipid phosphate phosphatase 3 n=1 Tax=Escovopsis weberi TaxID=150374 RepID=A0A0M8N6T3_ESCWE|nr:putative lipid phosphate phosphatase 3 [Escovopsis weberi]
MSYNPESKKKGFSKRLFISYAFDWIVLIAFAGIGAYLSQVAPNKRPFSLVDPNISFPVTENETVPNWLLVVLCTGIPVVIIFIVSIIFVPGATVPKGTPKALIWRRKLWELHIGWLGLLMSVGAGYFFISGIKNMCGKPRPDMLARCLPDIKNAAKYAIGGYQGEAAFGNDIGQLYSAAICQQTDKARLNDGFRSYPSGHAASSAGGLIYLSLFLASKFAVTFPFVAPDAVSSDHSVHAAFPTRRPVPALDPYEREATSALTGSKISSGNARHNSNILSLRRQAAAPPVYLLVATIAPFCLAIFISASRWFDFRHHGFDILFGFLIGLTTAIFSFRYYHLPITMGAGWAWAPRSEDRAFWAGVGRLGYVSGRDACDDSGDADSQNARLTTFLAAGAGAGSGGLTQRLGSQEDVELRDLESQRNSGL